MNPILSVIIPAYKFQDFILECVTSVTSQKTDFDFEVIISDDCSGDETNKRLKERFGNDCSVRIIENEKNQGAYQNIKMLLAEARGEYIAYLDGDDFFDDINKLQEQVDFLRSNPEYSMHSTGYKYVDENNKLLPPCDEGGRWLYPVVEDITTEDLLEKNQVGFGRVFRNYPNLLKDEYSHIPYVDWVINFECSLRGKIKCIQKPTGFYRLSSSGMYSGVSEENKEIQRKEISNILKQKYSASKTISIIDCFIHDERIGINLMNLIDKLKSIDQKVLLISNTIPSKRILQKLDHFIYDSRNQLFQKDYPGVIDVDFWVNNGSFTVHDLKSGLQKHGLSVLINLFNAIELAKSMGYTHFQRFETDDLYGPNSMEWIKSIPKLVFSEGKKGIFYLNPDNTPPDASFHYYFCEIDYFKSIMRKISCEEDYESYLMDFQGNREFRIVESYLYDHIMRNDTSDLLIKRNGGIEMRSNFSDTIWNTVVSSSNLPTKYNGCVTDIYKIFDQNHNFVRYCVYSNNYNNTEVSRRILVNYEDGDRAELYHQLSGKGSWCLNDLEKIPASIEVYENDAMLYLNKVSDSKSYIKIN